MQIYKENTSYFRFNQFFFRLGLQLYKKLCITLPPNNYQTLIFT